MSPDEILDLLAKKPNFEDLGRGATLNEVTEIERDLSVSLPAEYKAFMEKRGYVFWFGNTILGVADDESDSVTHWTKKARQERIPSHFTRRPTDAVVVKQYGGGGYYVLYCHGSPRTGEVALLLDEIDGKEAQSWGDFWKFLQQFIE